MRLLITQRVTKIQRKLSYNFADDKRLRTHIILGFHHGLALGKLTSCKNDFTGLV